VSPAAPAYYRAGTRPRRRGLAGAAGCESCAARLRAAVACRDRHWGVTDVVASQLPEPGALRCRRTRASAPRPVVVRRTRAWATCFRSSGRSSPARRHSPRRRCRRPAPVSSTTRTGWPRSWTPSAGGAITSTDSAELQPQRGRAAAGHLHSSATASPPPSAPRPGCGIHLDRPAGHRSLCVDVSTGPRLDPWRPRQPLQSGAGQSRRSTEGRAQGGRAPTWNRAMCHPVAAFGRS
jgi:hypothetical protein